VVRGYELKNFDQENLYEKANDGCSEPGGSFDVDVRNFIREVREGGLLQRFLVLQ